MKRKLNSILLVDDDEPTNFIHKIIIERANCSKEVVVKESGEQALEYVKSKKEKKHAQPDLILLDINMPGMNGWDFIEAYEKLDLSREERGVLIMLTTSINPDDEERAKTIAAIDAFHFKPLSQEVLIDIAEKHFSEEV